MVHSRPPEKRRYTLSHELTSLRGGQGQIFLAIDHRFNRQVLVKKLRRGAASVDDLQLRFEREARVTAQLQHSGVVHVYDYYTDDDDLGATVMEFVRNDVSYGEVAARTLDDVLDARVRIVPSRDDPEFCRLINVLVEVCSTVDYAHARGLIHRDLKCANILVTSGRVAVIDWGLVKIRDESDIILAIGNSEPGARDSCETGVGDTLGTIPYAAPEQIADPAAADERSDIYSVGVILYRVLTGALPGQTGGCLSPREINRKIPRTIEAICMKAISEHPAERYRSLRDLGSDLSAWIADQPITAHPDWLGSIWRMARRHQLEVSTIALLGVALLTGLAVVSSLIAKHNIALLAAEERTEAQRDKLFEAVDDLVNKTSRRLGQLPGTEELQKDLLTDARRYIESVASTSARSKQGRVFRARANYRLAQIAHQLRDRRLSDRVGQAALTEFSQLASEFPEEQQFQFDVFHCHFLLEDYSAAFHGIQTLCDSDPKPEYIDAYAAAAAALAREELLGTDKASAKKYARAGLAKATQLAQDVPWNRSYRRHIATNSSILAEVARASEQFKRALEFASVAVDENLMLHQSKPMELSFLLDTVYSCMLAVECAMDACDMKAATRLSSLAMRVAQDGVNTHGPSLLCWHRLVFATDQHLEHALYSKAGRNGVLANHLANLEVAHGRWPDDEIVRCHLALTHLHLHHPNVALRLIEHLDIDSLRADLIVPVGRVYLRNGDLDAAERSFRMHEEDPRFRIWLALVQAHKGNLRAAKQTMESVTDLSHLPLFLRTKEEIDHVR